MADFAAFQHGYRRCRQVAGRLGYGRVQCWIIDFGPSSFLEFQIYCRQYGEAYQNQGDIPHPIRTRERRGNARWHLVEKLFGKSCHTLYQLKIDRFIPRVLRLCDNWLMPEKDTVPSLVTSRCTSPGKCARLSSIRWHSSFLPWSVPALP